MICSLPPAVAETDVAGETVPYGGSTSFDGRIADANVDNSGWELCFGDFGARLRGLGPCTLGSSPWTVAMAASESVLGEVRSESGKVSQSEGR